MSTYNKHNTFFNEITLHSGYCLKCTFANSEDLEEMPHNAAFHQGLHYLQSLDNTVNTMYIAHDNHSLWALN